ncbi:hypothetical protein CQ054_21475 [Ochrobactrum sp. MYb29]|nr:hypothetical protein CQ054_21475 [Ochrobactrum sp. MYb29]
MINSTHFVEKRNLDDDVKLYQIGLQQIEFIVAAARVVDLRMTFPEGSLPDEVELSALIDRLLRQRLMV